MGNQGLNMLNASYSCMYFLKCEEAVEAMHSLKVCAHMFRVCVVWVYIFTCIS